MAQTWRLEPGRLADCSALTAASNDPKGQGTDSPLCRALNQLSCDPAKDRCWHEFGAALDGQSFDILSVRFSSYNTQRGDSPIDWIEFELTPCRESDTNQACKNSTIDSSGERVHGYIAYWYAPSPIARSPVTGPLETQGKAEQLPSVQLPVNIVRSLDGMETMDRCMKIWGGSREGIGLCSLEAMID
ncbi:MAG: hypothetical protein ACREFM_22770, partial [Hypericibacter sp.]